MISILITFSPLASGQKWRELKIRARRNSWAVEHRNQFPVPPAESDEDDEDTSWFHYTTYIIQWAIFAKYLVIINTKWPGNVQIVPVMYDCPSGIPGLSLSFAIYLGFYVVPPRNLGERTIFGYFEIRNSLFQLQFEQRSNNLRFFPGSKLLFWSRRYEAATADRKLSNEFWTFGCMVARCSSHETLKRRFIFLWRENHCSGANNFAIFIVLKIVTCLALQAKKGLFQVTKSSECKCL